MAVHGRGRDAPATVSVIGTHLTGMCGGVGPALNLDPTVGDRDRTSSAARAADVDNSSRELPEWAFFRGCRVLRGIVDGRACGMLGFRGMRGEHALRRFSHQHLPSCRHGTHLHSRSKRCTPAAPMGDGCCPTPYS
jgi:hypothetical protein